MGQMAIIADDLTGASDSGVQFARKGLATSVVFDLQKIKDEFQNVDTVVIDTDSRAIPASEAYERVKHAAEVLRLQGFTQIYKKLDSTLRGNLGAEIDAVMDVNSFDFAAVAPAFPKIGRTTVAGRHFLNGIPIDQTEIAKDPKCPVKDSDLMSLLSSQSKRKNGLVSLETIRFGRAAIKERIEILKLSGVQVIVFDAETDQDLIEIASVLALGSWSILWVGSAGLADFLPELLGLPVKEAVPLQTLATDGPVMLVAGSLSQVTRQQVSIFANSPNVVSAEADPLKILKGKEIWQQEKTRCLSLLRTALADGNDTALTVGSSPEQVMKTKDLGKTFNMDPTEVSNRIADGLGEIAADIIQSNHLQGVILTGGDTAKAVCRHLGVTGIELLKEVEPGVPLSRLIGHQGLLTVTKAGAFGTEQTLVNALQALKGVN